MTTADHALPPPRSTTLRRYMVSGLTGRGESLKQNRGLSAPFNQIRIASFSNIWSLPFSAICRFDPELGCFRDLLAELRSAADGLGPTCILAADASP